MSSSLLLFFQHQQHPMDGRERTVAKFGRILLTRLLALLLLLLLFFFSTSTSNTRWMAESGPSPRGPSLGKILLTSLSSLLLLFFSSFSDCRHEDQAGKKLTYKDVVVFVCLFVCLFCVCVFFQHQQHPMYG